MASKKKKLILFSISIIVILIAAFSMLFVFNVISFRSEYIVTPQQIGSDLYFTEQRISGAKLKSNVTLYKYDNLSKTTEERFEDEAIDSFYVINDSLIYSSAGEVKIANLNSKETRRLLEKPANGSIAFIDSFLEYDGQLFLVHTKVETNSESPNCTLTIYSLLGESQLATVYTETGFSLPEYYGKIEQKAYDKNRAEFASPVKQMVASGHFLYLAVGDNIFQLSLVDLSMKNVVNIPLMRGIVAYDNKIYVLYNNREDSRIDETSLGHLNSMKVFDSNLIEVNSMEIIMPMQAFLLPQSGVKLSDPEKCIFMLAHITDQKETILLKINLLDGTVTREKGLGQELPDSYRLTKNNEIIYITVLDTQTSGTAYEVLRVDNKDIKSVYQKKETAITI